MGPENVCHGSLFLLVSELWDTLYGTTSNLFSIAAGTFDFYFISDGILTISLFSPWELQRPGSVLLCIHFLSCQCDKIPHQVFGEGRIYFGSQFEGIGLHVRHEGRCAKWLMT